VIGRIIVDVALNIFTALIYNQFLNVFVMVNGAIIKDNNTPCSRMWVDWPAYLKK
jgi:hypothetical protein